MHIFHKWLNWTECSSERDENSCIIPARIEQRKCSVCNKTQVRTIVQQRVEHDFRDATKEQALQMNSKPFFKEREQTAYGFRVDLMKWVVCRKCGKTETRHIKCVEKIC